jgi:chemotaxis protein MotB
LKKLKEKLEAEIKAKKELEKLSKQIEITITPEGLRIELLEGKDGTFYQSGSPLLSANGQMLLTLLAGELKTLPNSLLIEGHTDATQYSTDANYSNWELSSDRANTARRLLQQGGVRADQVTQIRGYADQFLRVRDNPYDPSNRRISILVKNGSDGAAPPAVAHARVVDGAAGANAAAGKEEGPAAQPAKQTEKPAEGASAQGKPPAAGPVAVPVAKTGLMGKLMGMLPGKKK